MMMKMWNQIFHNTKTKNRSKVPIRNRPRKRERKFRLKMWKSSKRVNIFKISHILISISKSSTVLRFNCRRKQTHRCVLYGLRFVIIIYFLIISISCSARRFRSEIFHIIDVKSAFGFYYRSWNIRTLTLYSFFYVQFIRMSLLWFWEKHYTKLVVCALVLFVFDGFELVFT